MNIIVNIWCNVKEKLTLGQIRSLQFSKHIFFLVEYFKRSDNESIDFKEKAYLGGQNEAFRNISFKI